VDPGRRVVRRVEAGAGEPPVVLEAGLNNGAGSWQKVMPLLAPHVRVAAYRRLTRQTWPKVVGRENRDQGRDGPESVRQGRLTRDGTAS
jgi:hypothetical protein